MIEKLLVCDRSAAMFLATQLGRGSGYWTELMEKDMRRRTWNQAFIRFCISKESGWQDYYRLRDLVDYVDSIQSGFTGVIYERGHGMYRKKMTPEVFLGANFSDQGQLSVLSRYLGGYQELSPECALQYSNDLSQAVRCCSEYEFDFPSWRIVTKLEMASPKRSLMKLVANKQLEFKSAGELHG